VPFSTTVVLDAYPRFPVHLTPLLLGWEVRKGGQSIFAECRDLDVATRSVVIRSVGHVGVDGNLRNLIVDRITQIAQHNEFGNTLKCYQFPNA
jgi:hypothetical protein